MSTREQLSDRAQNNLSRHAGCGRCQVRGTGVESGRARGRLVRAEGAWARMRAMRGRNLGSVRAWPRSSAA